MAATKNYFERKICIDIILDLSNLPEDLCKRYRLCTPVSQPPLNIFPIQTPYHGIFGLQSLVPA